MTLLKSPKGTIEFGPGHPTLLINDQLRPYDGDAGVLEEMSAGRFDKLLELTRWGEECGIHVVDILIDHPGVDEVKLLPEIAAAITEETGCFICLDTRNPEALEAALERIKPHKAIINSVSSEPEVIETVLPIAVKYGAAVFGMPMGGGSRLPETVAERLEEARTILEAADACGLPREDMVMDGIVLASSAQPDTMRVTLDTIRAFTQELELTTILGIGNAGHGMPMPTWIDLAFLLAAIPCGLDAALVDPATPGLIESVHQSRSTPLFQ